MTATNPRTGRPRIRRRDIDGAPAGSTQEIREHIAAILERLDYLSVMLRLRPFPRGAMDPREREFDALVWALGKIVGTELVDRWMGKFEISVPGAPAGKAVRS